MDRPSRSVLDFARILRRAEDGGWGIVVLDLGVDMTTPNGRLVATRWSERTDKPEPEQRTPKGQRIPVPTRREFFSFVEKVAGRAGRKRPASKDQPPERSG
jgi:hypothetical protein